MSFSLSSFSLSIRQGWVPVNVLSDSFFGVVHIWKIVVYFCHAIYAHQIFSESVSDISYLICLSNTLITAFIYLWHIWNCKAPHLLKPARNSWSPSPRLLGSLRITSVHDDPNNSCEGLRNILGSFPFHAELTCSMVHQRVCLPIL